MTLALRTALIWRDEMMEDVVLMKPAPITLGANGGTTFTVPEIGLPAKFAVVRPGNRGYLLTLGERMRGTICIDGDEKDVGEFVHRGGGGDGPGGFRATPISDKDWGVVDLDESGDYKLYFSFVEVEDRETSVIDSWLGSLIIPYGYLATLFILATFIGAFAHFTGDLLGTVPAYVIGALVGVGGGFFAARFMGVFTFQKRSIILGLGTFAFLVFTASVSWWRILTMLQVREALRTNNWYQMQSVDLPTVVALAVASAMTSMLITGILVSLVVKDPDSTPALAFSVILHIALLLVTFTFNADSDPFVYPGPKSLTGNYLVTRLDPEVPPEPEPTKPTVGAQNSQEAAAASPTKKNLKTATKNDEGAAGGKGDEERARDPNAKDEPPEPPKVAFFEDKNKKMLDNIIDRQLTTNLSKFTGIKGDSVTRGAIGFGPGTGSGVGAGTGTGTTRGSKGKGSGGGGNVDGDFVSGKGVDTGKDRPGGTCKGENCQGAAPRQISLKLEEASGDFNGLSKEEIDRVVKARAGVFRACYQKELNRSPGIGGKLIINFVIDAAGTVKSSRTNGGTLKNEGVESCVKSNIMRLKFPAKGGAIVNYPFVFTQGG